MAKRRLHSPETLRKLLSYNPNTGGLVWRPRDCAKFQHAGRPALTFVGKRGYYSSTVLGQRNYLAHRVAWAIYYGNWPEGDIDHINGDRLDNRIKNLRCVSHKENCRNVKRPSTNTTGVTGVVWDKINAKWRAQIHVSGKGVCLGRYTDFESAVAARKDGESVYGFHPNHGRD